MLLIWEEGEGEERSMHLVIQWSCKLGSAAQPAFVHICVNEKYIQYVTMPICMCLPGPVNRLHTCDTHNTVLYISFTLSKFASAHINSACMSINTYEIVVNIVSLSNIPMQLQEIKMKCNPYAHIHTIMHGH